MLKEKIDMVGAQAFKGSFYGAPKVIGLAVERAGAFFHGKAELCFDVDLVSDGVKCFAEPSLAYAHPIDFGSIEEGDAGIGGLADEP